MTMDDVIDHEGSVEKKAPITESTEMETTTTATVDEIAPKETNDTTATTTTAETSVEVDIKKDEPSDEAKTETDVIGTGAIEENKEEKEEKEEKVAATEKNSSKPSESGRKKRKSSVDGKATATASEGSVTKRSSRDRKSVEVYDPKKYDKTDKSVPVVDGRGTALKQIPQCKDAIETAATKSPDDLIMAFKFVFGSKKKLPSKKEMVQQLLDFNGYLPKKDSSLSKEEQENADEELEAKFGARAYKLMIPTLKKVCDFFMVDRVLTTAKDDLVDKLLDFLGAPNKSKVKDRKRGADKKSKPTKRAKKQKKNNEEENDEDEDEDEEMDDEEQVDVDANDDDEYDDVDDDKLQPNGNQGELPTKEKLRKWVRAYVRCFHETKLTVNHALVVAGEKFSVDLLPMKADLKKLLIEEL